MSLCKKVHANPFPDLDYIAPIESSGITRKMGQVHHLSNIREHKTARMQAGRPVRTKEHCMLQRIRVCLCSVSV